MAKPMSKVTALYTYRAESLAENQPTERRLKALIRALEALGLTPDEMRQVCRGMDVVNDKGGFFGVNLSVKTPWEV